jgi:hypothetical protein
MGRDLPLPDVPGGGMRGRPSAATSLAATPSAVGFVPLGAIARRRAVRNSDSSAELAGAVLRRSSTLTISSNSRRAALPRCSRRLEVWCVAFRVRTSHRDHRAKPATPSWQSGICRCMPSGVSGPAHLDSDYASIRRHHCNAGAQRRSSRRSGGCALIRRKESNAVVAAAVIGLGPSRDGGFRRAVK